MCFPGLRQGLWVIARGHELVPWKDSLKPGGPAYFGGLMALTKLVGAPQCERGENQHLSNCGATWDQEQFPGGICLPACLWLSADPTQGASQALPSPFLSLHLSPSQPALPPSAPSCPPKTQTGHPELLQRSELRPPPAVRGKKAGEGRSRATGRSGARRGACRARPMRARRSRAGGGVSGLASGAGNYPGRVAVPGHPEWAGVPGHPEWAGA